MEKSLFDAVAYIDKARNIVKKHYPHTKVAEMFDKLKAIQIEIAEAARQNLVYESGEYVSPD